MLMYVKLNVPLGSGSADFGREVEEGYLYRQSRVASGERSAATLRNMVCAFGPWPSEWAFIRPGKPRRTSAHSPGEEPPVRVGERKIVFSTQIGVV